MTTHDIYMEMALRQAHIAKKLNEVPVGAVIVRDNVVIGEGYNLRETTGDPTAHAEIVAIRQAAEAVGDWRLEDSVLYVTLEPCPMCAGAILQSRIPTVVWGAADPKAGSAGTIINLLESDQFNHKCTVISGVSAEACGRILTDFFKRLR